METHGYHSERTRYHTSDQDKEAVNLFNRIKSAYAQKIEELNELKRQVFLMNTDQQGYLLDHHARSKLRILIESLLIDLNEEIFALSEELARSFASFDTRSQKGSSSSGGTPLQRALEFDQRKNQLMRKIKDSIDDNHSVRIIRRHAKIATHSPKKEMDTFGNEETRQ